MARRYLGFAFQIDQSQVMICGGINFASTHEGQLLDTEAATVTHHGRGLPKTDHFKNPSPLVMGRDQNDVYVVGQSKAIYKYRKDTGRWEEVHQF